MEEMLKSKVYVMVDEGGRVTRCEGGLTTPADLTGWIQIDEGTGDRYNLCQSNYFDGGLCITDGIPRYKLADGTFRARVGPVLTSTWRRGSSTNGSIITSSLEHPIS